MSEEQLSLLPDKQPKARFRRIPIDVFRKMKLIGPAPSRDMLATVKAIGVFQPIAVVETAKGKFKIGAGIRRVLASIETEQKDVPAMIYPDEGAMKDAITLVENTQRSSNPVAELMSIENLLKENFSIEQIADGTGMPIARVRKRLELKKLIDPLYVALIKRKISINVATAVFRLPKPYQEKLAKVLEKEERLTMADVKEVKTERKQKAVDAIPQSILMPEADCIDWKEEAEKWKENYEVHLRHVQQFLNDMYHVMVDPVTDFSGSVQELTALLLLKAVEQRQKEYDQQSSKDETPGSGEPAQGISERRRQEEHESNGAASDL